MLQIKIKAETNHVRGLERLDTVTTSMLPACLLRPIQFQSKFQLASGGHRHADGKEAEFVWGTKDPEQPKRL